MNPFTPQREERMRLCQKSTPDSKVSLDDIIFSSKYEEIKNQLVSLDQNLDIPQFLLTD